MAANVNDNNFFTAWLSDQPLAQWIKVDLGASKQVHYVTVVWARSTAVDYTINFTIEFSLDNSIWTTVFTGSSFVPFQTPSSVETLDTPNQDARYVRITATGGSAQGFTLQNMSITELGIWGLAAGTPSPPPVPPGTPPPPGGPLQDAKFSIPNSAITAIGNDGNVPTNVNDGSLTTRWSYLGIPGWIRFDLGETKRIAFVKVAWHKGDQRVNGYSIETSTAATSGYVVRKSGDSTGQTLGFETYDFTDVNARFVQVRVTSSQATSEGNLYSSISEIEIWGGDVGTSTPPPPGPPGSPPPSPAPPPAPPSNPQPSGQLSMMLNFNNSINDDSGMQNHALMDGGQMRFATGATSALGNSIDLNPGNLPPSPPPPPGTPPPGPSPPPAPGPPPIPAPVTRRITYFGGPINDKYNIQIYNIWWGSSWNAGTPQSRRNTLIPRLNTIVNSDHFAGMWQYRWTKKPAGITNLVWTGTPVPSGNAQGQLTFRDIKRCIQDCRNAGVVPNWDNFGENFPQGQFQSHKLDYRHLYFVLIPFGRYNPPGYGGGSAGSYTNEEESGTKGTVWYQWSSLNPPENTDPRYPQFNLYQMWEQAWAHEVFHHMEMALASGGCDAGSQGWTGHLYTNGGICSGIQHESEAKCWDRLRTLSGTNVLTESYWSDQDGKCIAPGSGDTWKRPPAGT